MEKWGIGQGSDTKVGCVNTHLLPALSKNDITCNFDYVVCVYAPYARKRDLN